MRVDQQHTTPDLLILFRQHIRAHETTFTTSERVVADTHVKSRLLLKSSFHLAQEKMLQLSDNLRK